MQPVAPPPFVNAAQSWAFWGVYVIVFAPEAIRGFRLRAKRSTNRDDRGSYVILVACVYLALGLAFFCAFAATWAQIISGREAFFVLGLALMLAGAALRIWTIRLLGKWFTFDVATQEGQTICKDGPYKLIRHPSYTAGLISIAGVALALGSWLSVLVAVGVASVGYAYRVFVEERVLCARLGDPYRAYMARTSRFIPFTI